MTFLSLCYVQEVISESQLTCILIKITKTTTPSFPLCQKIARIVMPTKLLALLGVPTERGLLPRLPWQPPLVPPFYFLPQCPLTCLPPLAVSEGERFFLGSHEGGAESPWWWGPPTPSRILGLQEATCRWEMWEPPTRMLLLTIQKRLMSPHTHCGQAYRSTLKTLIANFHVNLKWLGHISYTSNVIVR